MRHQERPVIVISIGDFNGIGPEVIFGALNSVSPSRSVPVVVSPAEIIRETLAHISVNQPLNFIEDIDDAKQDVINLLTFPSEPLERTPGRHSVQSGKVAMKSVKRCIELCKQQKAAAMVTAPISKEAVNAAGYAIPGHTEFLAEQTQTESVLMMLVSGKVRVALATTHVPIHDVAPLITKSLLRKKITMLADSLRSDFGIHHPKIAVFGLNPHAGDGGVIGNEEIVVITPVIEEFDNTDNSFTLNGPFPADGFFGQQLHHKHDAILAMYHDQGLAPFKLLSFGKGVNFTAGLPIIRTSPDHGTAFDIAGQGIANPSSFKEAYNLAVELANKK